MISKGKKETRSQVQMLCIEDVIPKDHILRDIDRDISLTIKHSIHFETAWESWLKI